MRISLKDKNMPFGEFKKMFKAYYADMHETVREKAIIADYEKATGKKYGQIKGTPKKRKSSGKKLGEDQGQST